MIKNYLGKISGPLLDRIDIQIEVSNIKYNELYKKKNIETSEVIRKRVNAARIIQKQRYKNDGIFSNSELTPKLLEKYCELSNSSKKILELAFENLKLSSRAYARILKVARTIADLDGEIQIQDNHLLEAIQYRALDKKYIN